MKTRDTQNLPFNVQPSGSLQSIQSNRTTRQVKESEKAKAVEQGFSKLLSDVKQLERVRASKDAVAYRKALDEASDQFNQLLVIAKQDGGSSGQEVQNILFKVSQSLVSGETGLNLNMDGGVVVNEVAAKDSLTVSSGKATAAIRDALSILQQPRGQASSGNSMYFANETSHDLSKTYDAKGGIDVYSGPSRIYQLS